MESPEKSVHSKSEMKLCKKQLKQNDNNEEDPTQSNTNRNNLKESSEEEEDQQFPIEKIIARRFEKKTKKIEYFVKWQGYDYADNTWELMISLIEDNCFEKIYDYENMTLEAKIELLNQHKKLKKLRGVTEETIRATEYCEEMDFFRNNYEDFNPQLKEELDKWDYGNLNDDEIDYIVPYIRTKKEGMYFRCYWKKRQNEDMPRKSRFYPYIVIKNVDKDNFHKAFFWFDQQD